MTSEKQNSETENKPSQKPKRLSLEKLSHGLVTTIEVPAIMITVTLGVVVGLLGASVYLLRDQIKKFPKSKN